MEDGMSETKKLGDILKEAGLIDDFQLQSALSQQRNWGGKLGAILLDLEFVREEDLARVMSDILRIPYVNLFDPVIPDGMIKMIKAEIAKKYQVVPVKKESGALVLAMFDPLDLEAIDEIRFITGLNIKPSLAMKSEIRDAIRKYYDGEEVNRDYTKTLYHQPTKPDSKMELIRGSDLMMPKSEETGEASPLMSKEATAQLTMADMSIRLDALISVLIEKGVLTRDELVKRVYQKKIGL
jgi:type IV pilus assembly protein PilB